MDELKRSYITNKLLSLTLTISPPPLLLSLCHNLSTDSKNMLPTTDTRRRNSNSSEADGNVLANIEDANSSTNLINEEELGQEVVGLTGLDDIIISGGDPSINRQFDPSSSDASSHPSNGVADANHCQERRNGWGICKLPNCSSIGWSLLAFVAVVACVYTIIDNNMKKNALISDLQTEISSLKNKEQQYLLNISQLGGGKKGKAGKDECCACTTSSVSSFQIYPYFFYVLCAMAK